MYIQVTLRLLCCFYQSQSACHITVSGEADKCTAMQNSSKCFQEILVRQCPDNGEKMFLCNSTWLSFLCSPPTHLFLLEMFLCLPLREYLPRGLQNSENHSKLYIFCMTLYFEKWPLILLALLYRWPRFRYQELGLQQNGFIYVPADSIQSWKRMIQLMLRPKISWLACQPTQAQFPQ